MNKKERRLANGVRTKVSRVANSRLEVVQLGGTQLTVVVSIKLLDEMLRLSAIIAELRLQNLRRFRQAYRPKYTHSRPT